MESIPVSGSTSIASIAHPEISGFHSMWRLLLGPVAGFAVYFLPLGLSHVIQETFAVIMFLIVYWIAEPIDHAVTALIGCYLFWALGVTKFSAAFSGFASATPWFLFGGALMAEAATSTGLAKRLGYRVLSAVGTSYGRLLLGVSILSFLSAPLVPSSTARISIIAPMLIGILAIIDTKKPGNAGKGLFLALTMMSMLVDKMMLAGATPVLTQGIIKEQTGINILWGQWFIAFLPATLLTIIAVAAVARWLFPARHVQFAGGKEYLHDALRQLGPISPEEKKVAATLGCAIALWATDFLHHLEPTVIGLGAGLILAVPKLGVLDTKAVKKVNFLVIIFSAGALSMANVLAQTQALDTLNHFLAAHIAPYLSSGFWASISLYWGGVIYHFLFPNNQSLLSTSLPLLLSAVKDLPYDPAALGLIWQFATGGTLFAYQSSVIVMGYSFGYFSGRDWLKYGAALTLVQALILMLTVPLYWPLIGLSWTR